MEGVGKTKTGDVLADILRKRRHPCARLDGELTRRIVGNDDFTDVGRMHNANTLGLLGRTFLRLRYNVIVSAVLPNDAVRKCFVSSCGSQVFWVDLRYQPFVTREHGLASYQELGLEYSALPFSEPLTAEERAYVIYEHYNHSWLSI
jgi:hypothetical protein